MLLLYMISAKLTSLLIFKTTLFLNVKMISSKSYFFYSRYLISFLFCVVIFSVVGIFNQKQIGIQKVKYNSFDEMMSELDKGTIQGLFCFVFKKWIRFHISHSLLSLFISQRLLPWLSWVPHTRALRWGTTTNFLARLWLGNSLSISNLEDYQTTNFLWTNSRMLSLNPQILKCALLL